MTHYDLVIRARRAVVDGAVRQAAVAVTDGTIVAVHTGARARSLGVAGDHTLVLDEDVVLLPGLVDPHVNIDDPAERGWQGFGPVTEAASRGGVTTVLDLPLDARPQVTSPEIHADLGDAATGYSFADVGFWAVVTPDNIGRLRQLWDDGVFGLACTIVDRGAGACAALDQAQLETVMTEVAALDGLLAVDTGDEPEGVYRVLEVVRRTGCRTHLLRFSVAEALPTLREARADGLPLTAEVCAHLLSLSSEKLAAGRQVAERWCPPVRDAAHREQLWEGLRDGTLDCVVSGHSPEATASVQLALPVTWTEARLRGFGLPDLVRWMSESTAVLLGLDDRGGIRVGAHADFTVFADDEAFVVLAEKLQHTDPESAFVGRALAGVVRHCVLDGKTVGSRLLPRGSWLRRGERDREPLV